MCRLAGLHNIREMLCENIYRQLVDILEYKDSSLFRPDETKFYDALYYVKIEKNEYPVVGICCMEDADEARIAKQHLLYWNKNDVPISILVLNGEIRIYNNFSRKHPNALLYNSSLANGDKEFIYDLKASRITSNIVWERLARLSDSGDRVDKQLLSSLRNTVLQAVEQQGMLLEDAYNFMSLCIFVKYLEDRKMITSQFFSRWNVTTFSDFLGEANPTELDTFFSILKDRFNGDLFAISKKNLPSIEQRDVFYRFFRGDDIFENGNSQLQFFPYDFSIIPIELISNIYETFFSMDSKMKNERLSTKTGAFYTPYYLAEFMVQKTFLPFMKQNKIPTVMDPACGSGVFLVNSFKRQIEIIKKHNKQIKAENICLLIKRHIFGIDINLNALKISCFSLYVALLDELTPKDIMENNFKFPNLIGDNLIEGSFFSNEMDLRFSQNRIDIIIGNPPWKSLPGSDHMLYCRKKRIPIADAQIAQAFLCRANDFSDERTQVQLLITNSIFTNKNSKWFLKYFLENNCIEEIINFEPIKTQLFAHAKYPCSILTYSCRKEENYEIKYQVFKENKVFNLLQKFVCDKNDEIYISKNKIINKEYIWTILTYGDEFDVECIEDILRFPRLNTCIDGKLQFIQGYITASKGKKYPRFADFKGGSLKHVFLPYGVDYENVPMLSPDILYDRPRDLEIYTCPFKVLIKRTYNEACWGAAFVKEPLIFSNDFSTFNDYSGKNVDLLRYIEGLLNSDVFLYYIFYMSKVKAAKKPEVTKADVENFPMPLFDKKNKDMQDIIQCVIQMENLVKEEWKLKQKTPWHIDETRKQHLQDKLNKLIFKLYGFDDFHISVIREGIGRFSEKCKRYIYADKEDYQRFSDYLCEYFNYYMEQDLGASWRTVIKEGDFYTVMYFSFGDGEIHIPSDIVGLSGLETVNEQLLVQRRVLRFVNDGFQIVQNKERSRWTLGKAKKLAAKITSEIMCAGGDTEYE